MPKLGLGKNHKQEYQIIVSLPRSLMELKDYCRLHKVLNLKDEDYRYAMNHGLDKLIEAGLVEVVTDEKKAVVPEPKPAPVAPKDIDIVLPANVEADKPVRDIIAENEAKEKAPEESTEEPAEEPAKRSGKKRKKNKE